MLRPIEALQQSGFPDDASSDVEDWIAGRLLSGSIDDGGAMGMIFLYDVEFVAYANPPHRKEQFQKALTEFFRANGLDFLMSALGGMIWTCGIVFRKNGEVSQQDRKKLSAFIRQQPIRAMARIGKLEEETDSTDYFRDITEWVFAVDNLTDADTEQAAAYHEGLCRRLQSAQPRPAQPGDATGEPCE